jgi:hypothetical protein
MVGEFFFDPDVARKVYESTRLMIESDRDRESLDLFRRAQLTGYFREKAKRCPETAKESRNLAVLFAKAARAEFKEINARLAAFENKVERYVSPLTQAEKEIKAQSQSRLKYLEEAREGGFVDAYAFSHIDTFIAQDPVRWERMQRQQPNLVANLARYRR